MKTRSLCGMSLVELIVAMGILSIVMTGMSMFIVRVWQTQAFIMRTNQASFSASHGVEHIVDLIRNAQTGADGSFPVAKATETEFTFFADENHDGRIERIHIFYDTSSVPKAIKIGTTNPTTATPPTYASGDDSVSVVANFVVNGGSNPVFTYYDGTNAALSAEPTLSNVRMVKIALLINENPSVGSDIAVSSFASLRNLWGK